MATYTNGGASVFYNSENNALFTVEETRNQFSEPEATEKTIVIKDFKNPPKYIPWGEDDDLPQQIKLKVDKVPEMGSNLLFNILATYGDGIKHGYHIIDENEKEQIVPFELFCRKMEKLISATTNTALLSRYKKELETVIASEDEIVSFFENNDLWQYMLEASTDLHYFYNFFPEIILTKEPNPEKSKIVRLSNKDATFSRWAIMDEKTALIPYHYYFAYWSQYAPNETDYVATATKVLDPSKTAQDLRKHLVKKDKERRFIIPVNFPTPGRPYYAKPTWYSIFESGIYDLAVTYPAVKLALLKNRAQISYIVKLAPDYFDKIYNIEGITDEKLKTSRRKKEIKAINDFLFKVEHKGKSIITFTQRSPTGEPYPSLDIQVVDNQIKTGEYVEDREELSSIISYAMMVHPSLIGSSPGKSKSINGTEARELFIIKQALLKPFRDRLLRPLNVIKQYNKWPRSLRFVTPFFELTTLDNDKTGSVTNTQES